VIKPLHKMTEAQVRKEMAVFPELEFVANLPFPRSVEKQIPAMRAVDSLFVYNYKIDS